MALLVEKYGGTSVKDINRVMEVALEAKKDSMQVMRLSWWYQHLEASLMSL